MKGIWVGLLGLGAFAALAGGFLLVRKLMDTQLPKVQKVSAAATAPGLCVLAWEVCVLCCPHTSCYASICHSI